MLSCGRLLKSGSQPKRVDFSRNRRSGVRKRGLIWIRSSDSSRYAFSLASMAPSLVMCQFLTYWMSLAGTGGLVRRCEWLTRNWSGDISDVGNLALLETYCIR